MPACWTIEVGLDVMNSAALSSASWALSTSSTVDAPDPYAALSDYLERLRVAPDDLASLNTLDTIRAVRRDRGENVTSGERGAGARIGCDQVKPRVVELDGGEVDGGNPDGGCVASQCSHRDR